MDGVGVKVGTGVGVAVALNALDTLNQASIGAGSSITAGDLSLQATVTDLSGDLTPSFTATATSGAAGEDIGVAGSLALAWFLATFLARGHVNLLAIFANLGNFF